MTGLYSVSMNLFGAIASGISVPIASIDAFDWRNAMQIWSIISLAAVIVLLLRLPVTRSGGKKSVYECKKPAIQSYLQIKNCLGCYIFYGAAITYTLQFIYLAS